MPVTPIIGAVAGGIIASNGAKSAAKASKQQTQIAADASTQNTQMSIQAAQQAAQGAANVYAYDDTLGKQVDPLLSGALGLDPAQRAAYDQAFQRSAYYDDVGNAVNQTARIAESNAAAQGRANVRGNGQALNALNANVWQLYNNARQQHMTALGARADQGNAARTGIANALVGAGSIAANAWGQNGATQASLYANQAARLSELKVGQANALQGYAGQALGGIAKYGSSKGWW